MAEKTAVVHIVGTPRTDAQRDHLCLHHSLGNGDFRNFAEIYARVTIAQTNLGEGTAVAKAEMVDWILKEAVVKKGPVYVELPTDMVMVSVEGARLEVPIQLEDEAENTIFEDSEVDALLSMLYAAERAVLVVDGFTRSFGVSSKCTASSPNGNAHSSPSQRPLRKSMSWFGSQVSQLSPPLSGSR